LRRHVLTKPLADMKVSEVELKDIKALHREITKTAPIQANRTVVMLRKCSVALVIGNYAIADVFGAIETLKTASGGRR